MGLFLTRIDNKEVSHIHRERHESKITHVRATPEDAHRELKKIKDEAREVLLDQMEVQNTPMPPDKFSVSLQHEAYMFETNMHMLFVIGDKPIVFREEVPEDLMSERHALSLVHKFEKFMEEKLPKYLLGETG